MVIYGDSVILIYYLEGAPSFKARASARLLALWGGGDILAISDLVRLECRTRPLRLGDLIALSEYDKVFVQPNVQSVPITTAVFDRATQLRATYNFKLADALHLAAAIETGCDRLLTNDTRLSRCTDTTVEVLP